MTPGYWKALHLGNDKDCLKDINPKAQQHDVVCEASSVGVITNEL